MTGFAHLDGCPVGDHRQRRHPVQPVRAQGRPLHRARLPAPDPAPLPPEHHRVHGRARVRGGRHRQGRGEARDGRGQRRGPQVHGPHRRAASGPATTRWPAAPTSRGSCGRGRTRGSRSWAAPRRPASCPRSAAAFADDAERDAFEAPILETYEREGSPYFATARLWDDGVIDPLDTRRVLAARPRRGPPRADPGDAVRRLPDVDAEVRSRAAGCGFPPVDRGGTPSYRARMQRLAVIASLALARARQRRLRGARRARPGPDPATCEQVYSVAPLPGHRGRRDRVLGRHPRRRRVDRDRPDPAAVRRPHPADARRRGADRPSGS